jgi:hypothetical protein
VYFIGKNNVLHIDHLKNNEWIDIPLIVNKSVIGKVSIDGWNCGNGPENYDIEIMERYCSTAGQMIAESRLRKKLEQRQETEDTILRAYP